MSWLLPFVPAIAEGIGSLFGDKGGRRRSTRKGQVRKTARRAYEGLKKKRKPRNKRRMPPRDKKGRFRRRKRRK